jgi:hypothetical protein
MFIFLKLFQPLNPVINLLFQFILHYKQKHFEKDKPNRFQLTGK